MYQWSVTGLDVVVDLSPERSSSSPTEHVIYASRLVDYRPIPAHSLIGPTSKPPSFVTVFSSCS